VFIGYACNNSCYKFFVIKSDVLESYTIIEVKNSIFFENVFSMKNKENVVHELIDPTNEVLDNVQELRRSKQARKENSFGNNFLAYVVEDKSFSHSDAIKFVDAPFWL
jgi:hypothetical protein